MIKMIVTDMDGTLLSKEKGLTPYTIDVLKRAISKGIKFCVATGRDLTGIAPIFANTGIEYSAILGNGAQYANEKGEITKTAYFPKERFKDVIKIFDEHDIHYMIFCDDGYYSTHEPSDVCEGFLVRGLNRFGGTREKMKENWKKNPPPCTLLQKIEDVDAWLKESHQIVKIEAFDRYEDKVIEAKKYLPPIPGIAHLSSFIDNVEVTDQKAQKGLILDQVIQDLGIKREEVAVFGDGLNDLTMFQLFEESYAMINGDEEIKKLAKYIAPDCNDEGVAKMVEKILEERAK